MKSMFTSALLAILLATPATAQEAPRSVAPETMKRWAPAFADYTDRVLFGDVWKRAELSARDRSLVTVSVLIATGRTAQLEGHLGRALDNGVRPAEIAGLVTHLAFYAGWPSAVSALEVVDKVMRARGIDPASVRSDPTPGSTSPSDGAQAQALADRFGGTAPEFAALSRDVVFDDLWRRSDLSPRDRSLVTIAAVTATGDADQLSDHLQRGLANGLLRAQIAEALTHLAFYAGWSKAAAGLATLGKAQEQERGAAGAAAAEAITVVPPNGSPADGPKSRFVGAVRVTSPFKGTGASRLGGATVTFRPGARTNWHSHPLGQLLIVTAGEGRVQDRGGVLRAIRAGDAVWTAPGVEHWHGAAPAAAMTHVAVSESAPGASVHWLEPVSDAVYNSSGAPGSR